MNITLSVFDDIQILLRDHAASLSMNIEAQPMPGGTWQVIGGVVLTPEKAKRLAIMLLNLSDNKTCLTKKNRWDEDLIEDVKRS